MAWSGETAGFLELPDELAGISAAMPQKKNYPVLERIRGRTAHVTGIAHTLVLANRNTAYANSVEVSKEASRDALLLFDSFGSAVRLLTVVLAAVRFRVDRMRAACDAAFMGGMALANELTLAHGIPWRTAQVVAGEYISSATGEPRAEPGDLLAAAAARRGYHVDGAGEVVRRAFDTDLALRRNASAGSTHPDSVRRMLGAQRAALDRLTVELADRRRRADAGTADVARLLGSGTA
jgi:argininosuccinate lyase